MGFLFHVVSYYSRKIKSCMHASQVSSVPGGTSQPDYPSMPVLNCFEKMCITDCQLSWLPKVIAQFLGPPIDYYPDLHKSWVELPVDGKNCTNPVGRVGWKDCAILEPNRLSEGIAQFLEGTDSRLLGAAGKKNCTNAWRLTCWSPLRSFWAEWNTRQ